MSQKSSRKVDVLGFVTSSLGHRLATGAMCEPHPDPIKELESLGWFPGTSVCIACTRSFWCSLKFANHCSSSWLMQM